MTERTPDEPLQQLEQEFEIDAPPEKVWRAVSEPGLREKWLPGGDLASDEPVEATPEREIRYRMRERHPPHLESLVTLRLSANPKGGTDLRIIHDLVDDRLKKQLAQAANSNGAIVMCAA